MTWRNRGYRHRRPDHHQRHRFRDDLDGHRHDPNLVARSLYVERLQEWWLPTGLFDQQPGLCHNPPYHTRSRQVFGKITLAKLRNIKEFQ